MPAKDTARSAAMVVIATAGKQSPRFGDFAIASFHLRDLRNDLSQ